MKVSTQLLSKIEKKKKKKENWEKIFKKVRQLIQATIETLLNIGSGLYIYPVTRSKKTHQLFVRFNMSVDDQS